MSEIPGTTGDVDGTTGDVVWQSSPPGSIYDHIKVASFSIGPDGLVEQWSSRAAGLFGMTSTEAIGRDPVEAFMPAELRSGGHRRVGEILDGKEWTGLVPFRMPGENGAHGVAEVYVMPSLTARGERAALCIVVDVRALRRIETDLAASQAIFGQSPFGFVLFGTDLAVVRANQRFATVFGGSAEDHRGRTVEDYLPRSEADRLTATLKRVLETGESVTDLQLVGPAPNTTERRHWSMNLYRVHSGAGRPVGIAGLATDVTRRHIAAREAASARRNLALLNEASARIGNSLDLETTARELLDVAVPGFCDLASVDLYQGLLTGEEAAPGSGASAHRDPAGGSAELRRVAHASAVADALPTAVAGSGAPGPDDLPPALGSVHRFPVGSPCAMALRSRRAEDVPGDEMGFVQSTLAVPMVAHDTVVGLVQFSRTKGSEPFGERDRALATELAARAAVCIDNARLYRREHERALILQRSLLPPGDPEAAGLDIACRYLPGNAATEVGGDWFDVIELPGHRTALVVGDVMGRGLRAAVAMGELRTAVRTLALLDLEPAEVLYALDEVARGLGSPGGGERSEGLGGSGGAQWPSRAAQKSREADLSEVYLATCVYAVYDPVTRRCTIANAGAHAARGRPGSPPASTYRRACPGRRREAGGRRCRAPSLPHAHLTVHPVPRADPRARRAPVPCSGTGRAADRRERFCARRSAAVRMKGRGQRWAARACAGRPRCAPGVRWARRGAFRAPVPSRPAGAEAQSPEVACGGPSAVRSSCRVSTRPRSSSPSTPLCSASWTRSGTVSRSATWTTAAGTAPAPC
ncbi:hypothetical protein SCALM49S_03119 [Streptomyces californicus]